MIPSVDEDHFLVDVSGSLNRKPHTRATLSKVAETSGTGNRQPPACDRPAVRPQTFNASNGDSKCDLSNANESTEDQSQNRQAQRSVSQTSVAYKDDSKRSLPSIQVETVATIVAPTAVKGRLRPLSIVAKKEEREKEAKKAETASEKRVSGFDRSFKSFPRLTMSSFTASAWVFVGLEIVQRHAQCEPRAGSRSEPS